MEVRKAVDDNAKQIENGGALHGVNCELGAGDAFSETRLIGENNGCADNEEKGGKDEIGCGKAIPLGVVHLSPRIPAAVVVHHDHEGDGHAAQNIEREKSLHRAGSESRIVHFGQKSPIGWERWLPPTLPSQGCSRQVELAG